MLPREIWENGRKLKLPALRYGASNHDYIMYRTAREITSCLEKWLKVPLDYQETYLPAALMLNPYEGPVWMHSDQGQEIGDIRKVIKQTRTARKLVKQAVRLEHVGANDASDAELARALRRMKELPSPVSLWVENAACKSPTEWADLLELIDVLFSEYAKEREGKSGHQRARTVASVVRAIFEVHSDEPITLGVTEQVPEGDFGKCVQEIFSRAGIPVNFYRYAREAQKRARDDHQLKKYIDILEEHYVEEPPAPTGPIIYEVR